MDFSYNQKKKKNNCEMKEIVKKKKYCVSNVKCT